MNFMHNCSHSLSPNDYVILLRKMNLDPRKTATFDSENLSLIIENCYNINLNKTIFSNNKIIVENSAFKKKREDKNDFLYEKYRNKKNLNYKENIKDNSFVELLEGFSPIHKNGI